MKALKGETTGSSKKIILSSFCVIASFAVVLSVICGGARIAYNVKFGGRVVSVISDKQIYYSALDLVADIVEGENVRDVLPQADIETVITLNDEFDDCDRVVDTIIDNTDAIVFATRLYIAGESVGCADTDSLNAALSERKAAFEIAGAECEITFCDEIMLEEGYYLEDDISDISELMPVINALDVKTTAKVSVTESIAYKTVANRTSAQKAGYTKTEQQGVAGVKRITTGIVYINGKKTEETTRSVEIIKEPVDEIITVGTAKTGAAVGSSFVFPLPSGTWEISCPYGKGGHMGVDLRAPKGTAIMAVAAGTVVSAGYDGSYGNRVVIDHGNGMETLYAHASRICVSVGDTVSAGDVIALVGSTGYSTGYHLHFEVHIGSSRINPQPYIGL